MEPLKDAFDPKDDETSTLAARPAASRSITLITNRDGEIRTRDFSLPKRARYQAAPRPVRGSVEACVELKRTLLSVRTSG